MSIMLFFRHSLSLEVIRSGIGYPGVLEFWSGNHSSFILTTPIPTNNNYVPINFTYSIIGKWSHLVFVSDLNEGAFIFVNGELLGHSLLPS